MKSAPPAVLAFQALGLCACMLWLASCTAREEGTQPVCLLTVLKPSGGITRDVHCRRRNVGEAHKTHLPIEGGKT